MDSVLGIKTNVKIPQENSKNKKMDGVPITSKLSTCEFGVDTKYIGLGNGTLIRIHDTSKIQIKAHSGPVLQVETRFPYVLTRGNDCIAKWDIRLQKVAFLSHFSYVILGCDIFS